MPRIIPIRDLKNTTEISQMCHDEDEPIFITKNGYGDMVIMSMKAYEERMFGLDLEAKLEVAEEQLAAGDTISHEEVFARLRAKVTNTDTSHDQAK